MPTAPDSSFLDFTQDSTEQLASLGLATFEADSTGRLNACSQPLAALLGWPSVASFMEQHPHLGIFEAVDGKSWDWRLLAEGRIERHPVRVSFRNGRRAQLLLTLWLRPVAGAGPGALAGWVWEPEHSANPSRQRSRPGRDAVTQLLSRPALVQAMEAKLHQGQSLAAAVLCLEDLKPINDSLGLEVGDRLLKELARRLRNLAGNEGLVCRFGGDELAVVVAGAGLQQAEALGQSLLTTVQAPWKLGRRSLVCGATVGVSFGGDDSAMLLLNQAEIALHHAQAQGRGGLRLFDPHQRAAATERLNLEQDLRLGLPRGEVQAWFQPIVSLQPGGALGFEALARWRHPTLGLVSPAKFIPVAEDSGLIAELGTAMLEQACAFWEAAAPAAGPGFFVSVNVSARQLENDDLIAAAGRLQKQHRLPDGALKLEITESLLMRDEKGGLARLHALRDGGALLSLDDFGTGYSSLSVLHRFPLDTMKIDRAFVSGGGDAKGSTLLAATVALGLNLGLNVVAEGVEHEAQAQQLRALGCHHAQGWRYAPAMNPAEAMVWLLAQEPAAV